MRGIGVGRTGADASFGSDLRTVAPSSLSGSAAPTRAGTVGASPSFASRPGFVEATVAASSSRFAGRVAASCAPSVGAGAAGFANGEGIVAKGDGVLVVVALFALAAAARFDGMKGFGSAGFFVLMPLNFDAGGGTLGLSERGSGTLGFAMLGSGPFGMLAIGAMGGATSGATGGATGGVAGAAAASGAVIGADFGCSGAGGSVGLPLRAPGSGFAALGAIANDATGTAAAFVGGGAPDTRRCRAGGGLGGLAEGFAGVGGGDAAVAGFGGGAMSSSRSSV